MRVFTATFRLLAALALCAAPAWLGARKPGEIFRLPSVVSLGTAPGPPAVPPEPPFAPPRPLAPLASYVTPDDYPASALRDRLQGRVAFALDIGADGRIFNCVITSSSGSAALDAASCRILRSRARYAPARNRSGDPMSGRDRGELTWTLPE